MAFFRVTLYSKICNINPLNKNICFNKGIATGVSLHRTVLKDIKNEDAVSVADYYSGKSVFITGGTGFLGKTYIQKLLYSCPKINKIYMLVRARSKEEAKHRVTQMVENSTQLFNLIKKERPGDLVKLVPIVGDLSAPNLGIHPDEEMLLREEVSVVVHSAATINLTETLRDAFKINVTGTQNLLALAKRMKNLQMKIEAGSRYLMMLIRSNSRLQIYILMPAYLNFLHTRYNLAFLHISTTFCTLTGGKEVIEEIVYPSPINPNEIQKILDKYGHMRFPPENILGGHRNTYVFTKALSESLVQLNNGDLPTAIIRPSLIGSSNVEPYKGWLDAMNIHSNLMYLIAMGHIRVLNIDKNTIWDFIPVDYVANLMILAAIKCRRSTDIDVYNCASSFVNPVKMSKAISIFISDFLDNKSNKLPFPFVLYLKSNTLFRLLTPILQTTPAYINDLSCLFKGQKPKFVKSYRKWMELNDNITIYGGFSWRLKPDRVLSLIRTLNDEDKRNFPCDPNDIEWFEYFKKYSEGVRNNTLKNKK